MALNVNNAAAQHIPLGIKDESGRVIKRQPPQIPQHLPKVFFMASKGKYGPMLLNPEDGPIAYGKEPFTTGHIYNNHAMLGAQQAMKHGNAIMFERVKLTGAKQASVTLYAKLDDSKLSFILREEDYDPAVDPLESEYPLFTVKAATDGVSGNNLGFKLWGNDEDNPYDARIRTEAGTIPFFMGVVQRDNEYSTRTRPYPSPTGATSALVSLKRDAVHPVTNKSLFIADVLDEIYNNLDDPQLEMIDFSIDSVDVHDRHVNMLMEAIAEAEGATLSATDVDMFTLKTPQGFPYVNVTMDGANQVIMKENTPHFLSGGLDYLLGATVPVGGGNTATTLPMIALTSPNDYVSYTNVDAMLVALQVDPAEAFSATYGIEDLNLFISHADFIAANPDAGSAFLNTTGLKKTKVFFPDIGDQLVIKDQSYTGGGSNPPPPSSHIVDFDGTTSFSAWNTAITSFLASLNATNVNITYGSNSTPADAPTLTELLVLEPGVTGIIQNITAEVDGAAFTYSITLLAIPEVQAVMPVTTPAQGPVSTIMLLNPVYEESVRFSLAGYNDKNSELMDTAYNVESWLYDTGFSMATKFAIADAIRYRKDIFVALSTFIDPKCNPVPALQDPLQEQSIGQVLATRLRSMPESTFYGTSTVRAAIFGYEGELLNHPYRGRVSIIQNFISMAAAWWGAGNGKWKDGFSFEGGDGSTLKEMYKFNVKWVPVPMRFKHYDSGVNYPLRNGPKQMFLPQFKTLYLDPTSVLNSIPTAMAGITLEKIVDQAWREHTGISGLSNAQFTSRVKAFLVDRLNYYTFNDRYIIVPRVTIDELDENLGFSWSVHMDFYSPGSKTVQRSQIISRRIEDFEG